MDWVFLCHMKMVETKLKMLTFVCGYYGVNADETWMHGDWSYTTDYGIYGHEIKATERSPPDNLT